MSRVLSSSRSGKKSDWLSGRSLPILKMEFIQQMHSSERKQVGDREDWLTPSSSSSVASGSYFLFHILQLNYKANGPETHFKYVRAFIHLSCKDLSAYLKTLLKVILINFLRQNNSVSVTNENSVSNKLKKIVVEVISKIKMALNLFWHIP